MIVCGVDFQATATTQTLFDQVIKYLGLTGKFLFGLTQLQGRIHFKTPVEKCSINSKLDLRLTAAIHRLGPTNVPPPFAKLVVLIAIKMDF